MIFYQKVLKNFIADTLDENDEGILFDTQLYNNIDDNDFGEDTTITDTYKTQTKRKVPTMITSINGEYIPIPNLNGTTNSVEIVFDLAVDDMTGLGEEDEFISVDYDNTLSAIDEFKTTILANYFPLGTHYLMFGGEDSELVMSKATGSAISPLVYYLELEFKNNDIETIFQCASGKVLKKTATKLIWEVSAGNTVELDYEIDTLTTIFIGRVSGTTWHMSANDETGNVVATSSNSQDTITMGSSAGIETVLRRFLADTDALSLANAELMIAGGDIDTYVPTPSIDLYDFASKDTLTNHGGLIDWTYTCENLILYGSEGNAVFQVYPLTVVGQYKSENGINYHSFSLQLEAFIGDNFMFGNNFEYYLMEESDSAYTRVYPVDRQHSFGMNAEGRQALNTNTMSFVGSDSSLEWTQSFFYQPTKFLTSLVKKITTGAVDQNTIYKLKVQYPFWSKEYNVIIDGGGIGTDINSITTFTLQFKPADSIIVT